MRRSRPKKRAKRLEPKPAPGDLRIVQAFLNTDDLKGGTDELAEPRGLSDWLARHGLIGGGAAKLTKTDLGRALDVRDGIRALVTAGSREKVDADAVRRLDKVAQVARARVRFFDDGTNQFEADDLDEALGLLIALVVLARSQGRWPKLKICGDGGCRAVFYDFSSNGSTKWCTRRCGDRIRARTYRRGARYKERPHHSPPRIPRMFQPRDGDDA